MSDRIPTIAAIGLGSNLGDRRRAIDLALRDLGAEDGIEVVATSTLVETAPVGPVPQGPYLNGAALLATTLGAPELMAALLEIERRHGRVRRQRWGPRTIDLDLLLFGSLVLDDPAADLFVPHPRMHERRFVLAPLAEIAAGTVHPRLGVSVEGLLKRLEDGNTGGVSDVAPGLRSHS